MKANSMDVFVSAMRAQSPDPGNIAFGGPGKRTLYLTGAGGVRKIQMLAQGIQSRAK